MATQVGWKLQGRLNRCRFFFILYGVTVRTVMFLFPCPGLWGAKRFGVILDFFFIS